MVKKIRSMLLSNYTVWFSAILILLPIYAVFSVACSVWVGVIRMWDELLSSVDELKEIKLWLSKNKYLEEKRFDVWEGKRFLNEGRRP